MSNPTSSNPAIVGSPEEFARLFMTHRQRILGFLGVLLPNRSDAEDVAQEVSVVLWEKFSEFRPGTDFGAWAIRIAQLKVFEYRRRHRRHPMVFTDQTLERIAHDTDEMWRELERQQQALNQCLQALGARNRQLLEMRYRDNGTLVAAAKAIGRSVVTARAMLRQIHATLFECVPGKLEAEKMP